MIFKFLKYLQPTNYFSIKKKNGKSVFPEVEDLPDSLKIQLHKDIGFISDIASSYDLSWQAIQKGYIGDAQTISNFEEISVEDNYHFIRKYFHKAWVYYVLILRLFSLKNPVIEISGFYKTRHVSQRSIINTDMNYPSFDSLDSELLKSSPKVSVVIPTLNRYEYLKDVLSDLESQSYKNFEVIVIDQSDPFQKDFYGNYQLDLKVQYQEEKALWLARNTAIQVSEGNYLLFFDDDSRVSSDWIQNHLKCIDFFKADMSSGVSISKVGAQIPEHYSIFRISDQLDTGNVLIKKDVFKSIGLFDRQFEKQRMGDGEFGLRAYVNNYLNVSNPKAGRLHLKVDSGGLRQMGSWDAFRTSSFFAPRPIPSVLYFFRSYFGNKMACLAILRTVPLSILPYRFKKNKAVLILGVILSVFLVPLVVFQVYKSWKLSSKKLEEGNSIDTL